MRPMLAAPTPAVPDSPEWVHEVKWDGMRVLADVREGTVQLGSRTEQDVTATFPELGALGGQYEDMLLDGEVVTLVGGRPSFASLTERLHVASADRARRLARSRPVTFIVFDLLRLFGQDLTAQPWRARRALLESLELAGPAWQVPGVHDDGAVLLEATRAQGLEGVVSKRRDSPYRPGVRSGDWLKVAHRPTTSAVVCGWRPQSGGGSGAAPVLGAVLLGLPDQDGGLRFVGRMGSGLAGSAGQRLLTLLTPLERADSPFATPVPRVDAAGTVWVEPRVVVDVASLGTTGDRLRQPSFQGVRTDLTVADLAEGVGGGA